MSEQKHTQLPLKWDGDDLWHFGAGYESPTNPHVFTGVTVDKRLRDSPLLAANKAFIARAANTHYQLVAALEAALEAFDTGQRVSNKSCGPFGAFKLPETDLQKQIRAALQAAKEQP